MVVVVVVVLVVVVVELVVVEDELDVAGTVVGGSVVVRLVAGRSALAEACVVVGWLVGGSVTGVVGSADADGSGALVGRSPVQAPSTNVTAITVTTAVRRCTPPR
jgi:hypothetical protein